MLEADYVVVGAGSAGCALAYRLSEDGQNSVLVLEYGGTDFGPLILRAGSTNWQIAGIGFPEALMVDLEMVADQRLLVAATHGLGIYYLTLPPATR